MQTSSASIYAMVISIIVLAILMMACLGLFYIKKRNAIIIFLIGTLGYLIPQICIRYPLISLLQTSVFPMFNVSLVVFIVSFTTALFETIGRYYVIKIGLKHELTKLSGILIGLGHGSCEALFLLTITYINNLFIVYLAQLGGDSNQINLVLSAIGNVPLHIFYFTLLERVLYIAIQMGLSSYMFNQMLANKKRTFLYVLILHFMVDILITGLSVYGIQIEMLDCVIALIALISIAYVWKAYGLKKTQDKHEIKTEVFENERLICEENGSASNDTFKPPMMEEINEQSIENGDENYSIDENNDQEDKI